MFETCLGTKLPQRLPENGNADTEFANSCFPKKLYLTVFKLASPASLLRPSQPLALVTRTPLPTLPAINLHLPLDKTSQVLSISVTKCLDVTESFVSTLNNFTRCVWRDIYAKTFEDNISQMSYWFAPILRDVAIEIDTTVPASLIDWDVLKFTDLHNFENPIKWTVDMPDTELEDLFIVDPGQGARRFYSAKVNSLLRPSDQMPCQDLQGNVSIESILDFSRNYKKKSLKWVENPNQPVVQARLISHRRNWLDSWNDSTSKDPEIPCYICPERMHISSVSTQHRCSGILSNNQLA